MQIYFDAMTPCLVCSLLQADCMAALATMTAVVGPPTVIVEDALEMGLWLLEVRMWLWVQEACVICFLQRCLGVC